MTDEGLAVCEFLAAGETRLIVGLVGSLVGLQLCVAAQTLPTGGADVRACAVLVPHVSRHVIGLAEGDRTEGAAERFLLGVRPHVPGEFVGVPEAARDTDGTARSFLLSWSGERIFLATIIIIIIIVVVVASMCSSVGTSAFTGLHFDR